MKEGARDQKFDFTDFLAMIIKDILMQGNNFMDRQCSFSCYLSTKLNDYLQLKLQKAKTLL